MSTGTLVKITPTGDITRTRIERKEGGPPMDDIREALGGGFAAQIGVVFEEKKRTAYIDEDAKIKRNPPPVNAFATKMVQEYYAKGGRTVDILGNIVVWIPDSRSISKAELAAPVPAHSGKGFEGGYQTRPAPDSDGGGESD